MLRPRSESTVCQIVCALAFALASCASSPCLPPRGAVFRVPVGAFGELVASRCTETNARSSGRSYPRTPPCHENDGCARRAAVALGSAVILPLAAPAGNESPVGATPLVG